MLTIQHLRAGYGKQIVLHDVSLTIEKGQFVAILGPNGSGKSTLLRSIFGLTETFAGTPTSSVLLEGRSLLGLPTEAIGKEGIAYVPQRQNVFSSMNVSENLKLAVRHLDRAAVVESLAKAYELFPILAQRQKQRAELLSGGERQMLAIAIGWLSKPKLMLLDEPSAGLSVQFVNEVFRTLSQLCESGITLAVVEQNARSILRWCSYAYLLRQGQVAFQGTADELLADEETVKGYLGISRPI